MVAVTSGAKWRERRENGVLMEFPMTGNIARIRPLDMDFFLKQGRVHNILEGAVFEELTEKEVTALSESEFEAFQRTLDFLNEVVRHCFVEPKIVDDPKADNEISIADITLDEKYFLFGLLVRPAQALERFRPKQAGNVASVAAAKIDGAASESNHADTADGKPDDRDEGRLDGDSV
jgi:hypothetical protein